MEYYLKTVKLWCWKDGLEIKPHRAVSIEQVCVYCSAEWEGFLLLTHPPLSSALVYLYSQCGSVSLQHHHMYTRTNLHGMSSWLLDNSFALVPLQCEGHGGGLWWRLPKSSLHLSFSILSLEHAQLWCSSVCLVKILYFVANWLYICQFLISTILAYL